MKKHILFVLDYYRPHRGGVETVFTYITKHFVRQGYRVTVLTSRFLPVLPQEEAREGITIHRTGRSRLGFVFSGIRRGIQLLRTHKDISVIHTSTYGGAIPGAILGRLFRKKVVLTIHELFGKLRYTYKGRMGWLYIWFEKIIFRFPYHVYHCVSYYTYNTVRTLYGISDEKLHMIYNGVDTDFWDLGNIDKKSIMTWKKAHGWEDKFTILYYGHTGRSKGLDYLIDAIPAILHTYPNSIIALNLIPAQRNHYIRQKIAALGDEPRVQLYDGMKMETLRTMVASADVVVAPSLSEGFGSVHAEASALGKPFITTYVASVPEVVYGKICFVPPRSSAAIVQAIGLVQKKQYQSIAPKTFSWDETMQKIATLYDID